MFTLTADIWFVNLGLKFSDWVKSFKIGNFDIYIYGCIIAASVLLALTVACIVARRTGQNDDNYAELMIWGVLFGIIGARLYYVAFDWDAYKDNLKEIFNLRAGGLAIYGGIIAGFLTAFLVSRVEKFPYLAMMDDVVMGVLIGQAIGRWGNFMNREVFGRETALPWRMRLWAYDGTAYDVHPTFLYESLWNLAGFLLIWLVLTKRRRFDGENLLCYFLWYGPGRFWIEGIRDDQLYLFGATLFGRRVPVSQLLSAVLVAVSSILLAVCWKRAKRAPENPENKEAPLA